MKEKILNYLWKPFLIGGAFMLGMIVVYAASTIINSVTTQTINQGDTIGSGWFQEVNDKVLSLINEQDSLSGDVDDNSNEIQSISGEINNIEDKISKYKYKTYKVIGNGDSNSWKCAKIIVPKECMTEDSSDLGTMCKITHTQRHLPWDENPSDSYGSNREKQGGWERHFRIFPRGDDSNHETGKKRMMGGYTSNAGKWYTYTTTSTNNSSRTTGLGDYSGILGRDKRKNCSQYSTSSAGGSDKNPREIMLITRNDFAVTRTIKYPSSKNDSFFDKIFK